MSRIGKKFITIPPKVEVKLQGQKISVKGPKGTLNWEIPAGIQGTVAEGKINFTIPSGVSPGQQPVVVTIGGIPSLPANITIAQ